jgi:hypothetical protein
MPLSVLSSWKEDISRYCPIIKPYVHLGNQEERETNFRQWFQMLQSLRSSSDNKIDICLTTYDMALKDSSLFTLLSGKRQQSRRVSSSNPSVSWSYIVVSSSLPPSSPLLSPPLLSSPLHLPLIDCVTLTLWVG